MKDCTTCKYGFVDEQFGFPMCHHPSRFSEDCVDFNMHEEKEEPKKETGIEEKKLPDSLEEEIETYFKGWYMDETDQGYILHTPDDHAGLMSVKQVARHFAEWQKAKMMEKSYLATISANNTIPVLPMKDVSDLGFDYGDKVRVIVIKEDEK